LSHGSIQGQKSTKLLTQTPKYLRWPPWDKKWLSTMVQEADKWSLFSVHTSSSGRIEMRQQVAVADRRPSSNTDGSDRQATVLVVGRCKAVDRRQGDRSRTVALTRENVHG
jgi:hypothetical protein